MIKHIVMWKLADAANIGKFRAELESCKGLVPGMREFEVGTRAEGFDATVDVVLNSSFDDKAALEAYLTHPHHQKVAGVLGTLRESRNVLDFETN